MMFRNVHFDYSENKINLWETINGERMFTEIDWVPYIFVPDKEGDITTIYGEKAKKLDFPNYKKFKTFTEDKGLIKYEDHVKPELQFLAERYHQIPDDSLYKPDLRIGSLDIEVFIESSFPLPEEAKGVVTAISIDIGGHTTTWGIKPYIGVHNANYVYCKDEKILLKTFFDFMYLHADIDVLTGWNISGFDIPYLYYRCKKLFGENNKIFNKFSPIGDCSVWEKKDGEGLNFDIAGVSILDYMEVYKNYTRSNPESFKLDDIAFNELKERKLAYEGTLKDLYHNDWDLYIDYNVQDVKLIWKLEKKLRYINLIQTISLLSRCPMKFYDKVTNVLEGIFLTYYRRNKLCAPKLKGGKTEWFEAAYVKEPQVGLHEWVVDFDVTSMYPHNMITLNMSLETYFGCILDFSESNVIEYTTQRQFPEFTLEGPDGEKKPIKGKQLKTFNALLAKGTFAIAPNGAVFKTNKEGVVTIIEKIFFKMRKDTKNKMLQLKKEDGDKNKIEELETTQLGIKVGILNSLYGAISTPYFRLYNLRIAEAITSCGRHILKDSINFMNEYLNGISNTNLDFVLYSDTDSCDGGSIIYVNGKKISIEDYYNSLPNDFIKKQHGDWVKNIDNGDVSLSYSKDLILEEKPIKYIMKHWVKKRMFKISIDGRSVEVTEDHSIIILRDEVIISVRPKDIKPTDEIIYI